MVLITIVNGVYKPTYNWGAPHCMGSWGFPRDNGRTKFPRNKLNASRIHRRHSPKSGRCRTARCHTSRSPVRDRRVRDFAAESYCRRPGPRSVAGDWDGVARRTTSLWAYNILAGFGWYSWPWRFLDVCWSFVRLYIFGFFGDKMVSGEENILKYTQMRLFR